MMQTPHGLREELRARAIKSFRQDRMRHEWENGVKKGGNVLHALDSCTKVGLCF